MAPQTDAHTAPPMASKIPGAYAQKTPRSRAPHERAKALLSNRVKHIGRYLEPHPVHVQHAAGSHKWEVAGNEYVDYFSGHGALNPGHNHPAVVDAVTAQLPKGVHYGASQELEIEGADLIHELISPAGRVRFLNTGTEGTHLALRVARTLTGKNKIIRFAGLFHGWHDHVRFPEDGAPEIIPGILEDPQIIARYDTARVVRLLAAHDNIAAVILEPTGTTFGQIPSGGEVLQRLRDATVQHGVPPIFDEVIAGFRCSPGGARLFYL